MVKVIITALQFYNAALDTGFSHRDAKRLTCVAKYESRFNIHAWNHNKNGSFDHGVLQINDLWLNQKCSGLNPYQIYESLICARRILKERGFDVWVAYTKHKKECEK